MRNWRNSASRTVSAVRDQIVIGRCVEVDATCWPGWSIAGSTRNSADAGRLRIGREVLRRRPRVTVGNTIVVSAMGSCYADVVGHDEANFVQVPGQAWVTKR
jgi:hypothetical protein